MSIRSVCWVALGVLGTVACDVEELRYYSEDFATLPAPPDGERTACEISPDTTPCDAGSKCSIAREGATLVAVCVPLLSRAALGEPCDRTVLGYDDCGAGDLCTPLGSRSGEELACRQICLATAECPDDWTCSRLALQANTQWGVCVPRCEFFGDRCTPGAHCTGVANVEGLLVGLCQTAGDVAEGSACDQAGQCGAGLVCRTPEGICRAYCDPEHACPANQSCGVLGVDGEPDVGVCAATDR